MKIFLRNHKNAENFTKNRIAIIKYAEINLTGYLGKTKMKVESNENGKGQP